MTRRATALLFPSVLALLTSPAFATGSKPENSAGCSFETKGALLCVSGQMALIDVDVTGAMVRSRSETGFLTNSRNAVSPFDDMEHLDDN